MRQKVNISAQQFRECIFLCAEELKIKNYIIDENNTDFLNQFYFWLTLDERFIGDFEKGFLLYGGFGNGKTTMLHIIELMCGHFYKKLFEYITTYTISNYLINNKDFEYYKTRPIIIDEIGRENNKILIFGTERHPFEELITLRYDNKAVTFGATNLSIEEMYNNYNEYIIERFKAMFNFIEIKGTSKR